MSIAFEKSETHRNLLRAFAGESQARNRYTFAAGLAKKQNLQVIEQVFLFTADQERAHAKVYYDLLESLSGKNIQIDGTYPVDIFPGVLEHLRAAQHNEYQEWEHDYAHFADVAREEGFSEIAKTFDMIADIEKVHGDRFGRFADLLGRKSSLSPMSRCSGCASTAAWSSRVPGLPPCARCASTTRAGSSAWRWFPSIKKEPRVSRGSFCVRVRAAPGDGPRF